MDSLTPDQAMTEILELFARETPDEYYPKPGNVQNIHVGLEQILSRLNGSLQQDALRWHTLERHCRWIGICPKAVVRHGITHLEEIQHSFDPRLPEYVVTMRKFVDRILQEHEYYGKMVRPTS